MIRSPTACPSVSLYHLNPVMSTSPTADHRPRCSSARNDSSCSVKRAKFISFVLGSRCDLSVRSATSASKYREMLLTVASFADNSVFTRRHLVGEADRQGLNGFVFGFLPQPLVAREDRVDDPKQFRLDRRGQVEMFAHPCLELGPRLRLVRVGADLFRLHLLSHRKRLSRISDARLSGRWRYKGRAARY